MHHLKGFYAGLFFLFCKFFNRFCCILFEDIQEFSKQKHSIQEYQDRLQVMATNKLVQAFSQYDTSISIFIHFFFSFFVDDFNETVFFAKFSNKKRGICKVGGAVWKNWAGKRNHQKILFAKATEFATNVEPMGDFC